MVSSIRLFTLSLLLCATFLPGSALAGGSIGIYADPGGTNCEITVPAFVPWTLYVIYDPAGGLGGGPNPITGAEYRIDLPPTTIVLGITTPIVGAIEIGSPIDGTGVSMGFLPQAGPVLLHTIQLLDFGPPSDVKLKVEARNPPTGPNCPFVVDLASLVCVTGYCANINSSSLPPCSVTPPVADAGLDVAICPGGSTVIGGSPTGSGASPPYTYSWSPAAGLDDPTLANPTASPTTTTTYTVTVTNADCRVDSDAMTLTVGPTADAGPDAAICAGGPALIGGSPTGSGGTPPYTYLWSPAAGLNDASLANPTASPVATTTYTVTVTDAIGCQGTDSMILTVYPAPTADAGSNLTTCAGGVFLIGGGSTGSGGTPPYTYSWDPTTGLDDPTLSNPTASPATTTTYTVTVTDANGCTGSDSMTFTVIPSPVADAGPDAAICPGSSTGIGGAPTGSGGTPPYTYDWSPITGLDDATTANPTASPAATTTYTVTVTDANGCQGSDSMILTVYPSPTADAGLDAGICAGASRVIGGSPTGSGGTPPHTYSWSPTAGLDDATLANPTATPAATTIYTVTVTDANGCTGSDAVTLTVEPFSPPAAINDLAAAQVKTGNDGDGTTGITLTWGAVETGATVAVYRKGFGDYPEYDDLGGSVPTPPATPGAGGWALSSVTASGGVDETNAERDFMYFVAFVTDTCGDVSAVSNMTDGTLNYHLGDFVPLLSGPLGDNLVDALDISKLGIHYGTQEGDALYLDTLDVGPTSDSSTDGLPLTDNWIRFDDMIIAAINFENVSKPGPPPAAGNALSVWVPEERTLGSTFTVAIDLASNGSIKGVSIPLVYDAAVMEVVGYRAGELLERQAGIGVVLSPEPGTLDAAVFGSSFTGEGRLGSVQFRVIAAGNPDIGLGEVIARDEDNQPVVLEGVIATASQDPTLPTFTGLVGASPNPFAAGTVIRFSLAEEGPAQVRIFGIDGRLVKTLLDGFQSAGEQAVRWDGRDDSGRTTAAGTYLIQFRSRSVQQAERIVRLR